MTKKSFNWRDVIYNLDLIIVNLSNISIKIFELKEILEEPHKISSNISLIENLTVIQDKIVDITGVARSAREYARTQNRISSQIKDLLDLDTFKKDLFYIITNGNILYDLVQKNIIQELNIELNSDIQSSISNMLKSYKQSLEDIREIYLLVSYTTNN